MYDIIEAYIKKKNNHLKIIEEEYESNFGDYRSIDEEKMEKYKNKKLGELPFHRIIEQSSLNEIICSYDANS